MRPRNTVSGRISATEARQALVPRSTSTARPGVHGNGSSRASDCRRSRRAAGEPGRRDGGSRDAAGRPGWSFGRFLDSTGFFRSRSSRDHGDLPGGLPIPICRSTGATKNEALKRLPDLVLCVTTGSAGRTTTAAGKTGEWTGSLTEKKRRPSRASRYPILNSFGR